MAEFILQMVLVVSGGALLYLVARTLPRLDETDPTPGPRHMLPEWVMHYLERADEELVVFFERVVRTLRVFLMKFDNTLGEKMRKLKQNGTNGNGNGKGLASLEEEVKISEEREEDDK
ncbi:MAG: hypothetical protein HYU81_02790 [Candidatus Brennerbacteria bacterium]|nr:hypothetical protein [Candidatus Brennerbacteria bacterium]